MTPSSHLESYVSPGTVPYSLTHIIQILMNRDKCSRADAIDTLNACISGIEDMIAEGNWHDIDDIIMDDLGLEPDFSLAILDELENPSLGR